jgi:DNA-binding MarR family transcriptional regulator
MKPRNTTRVKLLDSDTGEVIDDGQVILVPNRIKMKEDWFMAMQSGLEMLAKAKLRGESMRVLLYLMSQMEFENYMRPTLNEIAENLKMNRGNVSRAIRELKAKRVLIDGEHESLRLESSYGWRGKVKTLREHQREQERQSSEQEEQTQEPALA